MFKNISKKIKVLATGLTILGAFVSIVSGFMIGFVIEVIFDGITGENSGGGFVLAIGLVIAIVGSILSWIISVFLYGFGEVVEKVDALYLLAEIDRVKDKEGNSTTVDVKKIEKPIDRCPNCGTTVKNDMSFCCNCGKKLK